MKVEYLPHQSILEMIIQNQTNSNSSIVAPAAISESILESTISQIPQLRDNMEYLKINSLQAENAHLWSGLTNKMNADETLKLIRE